jgi:hypothetical protein
VILIVQNIDDDGMILDATASILDISKISGHVNGAIPAIIEMENVH